MAPRGALTIAVVAGEESGDLLGADLVRALQSSTDREIRLVGVGGGHLAALGLRSLFDPREIALIGFGAVLRDLPRLAWRIGQAARAVAAAKPDCLVTIDVPDFALRVAERARRLRPGMPVVHYVCPSVWAWRPGRARAMKAYVDRVLCILPFEPAELERLGGPPGLYVGHRLAHDPALLDVFQRRSIRAPSSGAGLRTLLLLPGSRRGEVSRLLPDFRAAVSILAERQHPMRLLLPAVSGVRDIVEKATTQWAQKPELIAGAEGKWQAFAEADAALIASGTVALELALAGVPHLSTYRLEPVGRMLKRLIRSWSGALPNLIADKAVVPEFYDEAIRPGAVARILEALWDDTPMRRWQLDGFAAIRASMQTDKPAGRAAAEAVLEAVDRRRSL